MYLTRDDADEALVLGTAYRTAEVNYLSGIHAALVALASSLTSAATFPNINTAGTNLTSALTAITETDIRSDASAYISEKAFTE